MLLEPLGMVDPQASAFPLLAVVDLLSHIDLLDSVCNRLAPRQLSYRVVLYSYRDYFAGVP